MVGAGSLMGAPLNPQFKGIENFLRKIAFNLGNTPSQTEVKIISCIPIDVTDLQNKIVDLERELEERDAGHRGDLTPEQPVEPAQQTQDSQLGQGTSRGPTVGTVTVTPNSTPFDQSTRHAAEKSTEFSTVGTVTVTPNSTSFDQSSCDGAEITKEFTSHSLSVGPPSPSRASLALNDYHLIRNVPKSSTTISIEQQQDFMPDSLNDYDKSVMKRRMQKLRMMDKKKKGKTQMVYYTQMLYPKKIKEGATRRNKLRSSREEKKEDTYLANVIEQQYQKTKPINMQPSTSGEFSWPVCRDEPASSSAPPPQGDSDMCSCCHGLFHNVDIRCGADITTGNGHQHSAYYDSSLYDVIPVKEKPIKPMKKNDFCQNNEVYQNRRQDDVYLEMERNFLRDNPNLPRVQFEQQFTTEYCTVNESSRSNPKQRSKKKSTNKSALKREQVIRAMMQKRKHDYNLRMAEMSCSDYVECSGVYNKSQNSKPLVTSSTPRPPLCQPLSQPELLSPRPILKNAECLTVSFNDQETQSSVSRNLQMEPPPPSQPPPVQSPRPPPPPSSEPSEPDKTEITLNQIKNILHAVLEEVKTNTQKQVIEDKPRRDAVVQNGPSQNIIAAHSSFVNSYLYSPKCSFCPCVQGGPCPGQRSQFPVQAGCESRRLNPISSGVPPQCIMHDSTSNQTGNPTSGPRPCGEINKCVQNYPVFIHTKGRQCTCCYRSVPTKPNLPSNTQPANGPAKKNDLRNQETNNLIKEIYNSLAVNPNYTQKENSSNYSSVAASNKKTEYKFEPKAKPNIEASGILHNIKQPKFAGKENKQQFGTVGASYRSEVQTISTFSTPATESATPRGDRVRSLMSVKKELHSTSSENAHVHKRSPHATRKYSSPAEKHDGRYGDNHDHEQTFDRRDRSYSPPERHGSEPPSVHRMLRNSPPKTRDRRHSPDDKRSRRYSPCEERGCGPSPRTFAGAIVSEEDTAISDGSEESVTTVVGREKKKKGLFSKLKQLFTSRRRRRRRDSSSEPDLEATSDSDDYETVYSEITNPDTKRTKHHGLPSPPPPAPRQRRRPHSKVSSSRYHHPGVSANPNARRRHDSPVITVPAIPPRSHRSPYMEQEYRRHWAEDVGFHQGDTPRYSSRSPRTRSRARREFNFARYMNPPSQERLYSLYRRDYQVRPVFTSTPHPHLSPQRPPGTTQKPYAALPPKAHPRIGQSPNRLPRAFEQPYYTRRAVPSPYQYRAPATVPPYTLPRYNAPQDQMRKCGQTLQAPNPFIVPQEQKHLYVPQSYKPPANGGGNGWIKNFNKCTNFNCGVNWKEFFLER